MLWAAIFLVLLFTMTVCDVLSSTFCSVLHHALCRLPICFNMYLYLAKMTTKPRWSIKFARCQNVNESIFSFRRSLCALPLSEYRMLSYSGRISLQTKDLAEPAEWSERSEIRTWQKPILPLFILPPSPCFPVLDSPVAQPSHAENRFHAVCEGKARAGCMFRRERALHTAFERC